MFIVESRLNSDQQVLNVQNIIQIIIMIVQTLLFSKVFVKVLRWEKKTLGCVFDA